ncbi:hypothetical protein CLAFUW4_02096 [Fulvia fulva]|uniref:Uncharacterized protein n=1 Tax=Passalora fulva TaxID=5499 RepID=A0A9Q8P3W7_PASFU|nr:uncharacterized protein CLAFUR5_02089 [Fulvia fulva]KAK4634196.1 hypothetical protein CLAFUR4_02092 [Fulvia fulva]KAK4636935.1 hypothetical protein CLAFUR0_02095 [Fulvia fulva]UJO12196.1 hypothetical protein CLAFUR5_02089 [Fulvia fulva]WPV09652.1 hypothetical protein CLAFUW4_02096 [Fulvia fulva]WPV25266.1 hypothetical protein CLAFUW7_02096 [Fulvia fulva]
MLFCFLLLALLGLAAAKPTHFGAKIHYKENCSALIEDDDWIISDLVEFQPKIAHLSPFLAFNVRDINKGLQINTTCSIVLSSGSNSTLHNPNLFHVCENRNMRFQYSNGSIEMSRLYRDPCLGDYPYDSAIAWGHATANFTTTKTAGGSLRTATQVHVPITSLS